ncbi:peptidoglycan N-acetylmuramoylhydrolase [Chromobacterium sp. LK1]|nr:peptidoglycan N-acetylmuramoylhydrolase [Chromobacterium sp. LK1]
MNRFTPLALSLSFAVVFASAAHAENGAFRQSVGVDEGLAAGLDMMLLNSSLLRNGDNVWERAREGFQLPEVNADIVRRQERFYASKPEYFRRTLDRSRKYLFHIMNEVERRGMPTELALLPLVESAFVPTAKSHVGAAGLWQFMPATGRQYGLEQTWWYDGRRDVTEATRAALDYLENLYAQFGDWNIALAAYNWGEGNVSRAIARLQASGQEVTYENIRMPNETRNYAPKLLAVRNILNDPAKFGVRLDKFPNKPYFVAVSTGKHMNIDIAAKLAGMSINEFKELNPAFNLPVYAHKNGRQMLIPAAKADKFEANLAKWDKPLLTWEVYTPPADTSASQIASEHGMSAGQLLAANNLSSGSLKAGQPVLVAMSKDQRDIRPLDATDTSLPERGNGATLLAQADSPKAMPVPSVQPAEAKPVQVALASPAPAAAPRQDIKPAETVAAAPAAISADADGNYTVTAGDTLYSIARRFDIGLDDLKTVNGMDSNIVKVGQVLNINKPIDKGVSVTLLADNSRANAQQDALLKVSGLQTSQRATGSVPAEYVVQRGDTLFSIARRFGVNHNDIQRWNDSRQLTRLQPGQKVRIQGL